MNFWKKLKSYICVFIICPLNQKNTIKHINIPLSNIILTGDIGYWNVNCKKTFVLHVCKGKDLESKQFRILQHRAGWETSVAPIEASVRNCVAADAETRNGGQRTVQSQIHFIVFTIQVLLSSRRKQNVKLIVYIRQTTITEFFKVLINPRSENRLTLSARGK